MVFAFLWACRDDDGTAVVSMAAGDLKLQWGVWCLEGFTFEVSMRTESGVSRPYASAYASTIPPIT